MQLTSWTATAIAFSNLAFTKYSRSQSRYADGAGGIGLVTRAGGTNFVSGHSIFTAFQSNFSSNRRVGLNSICRLKNTRMPTQD